MKIRVRKINEKWTLISRDLIDTNGLTDGTFWYNIGFLGDNLVAFVKKKSDFQVRFSFPPRNIIY